MLRSGSSEDAYGTNACNDGVDDDSDGTTDAEDPGCASASDTDETDPTGTCYDDADDDGDGWHDVDDPDCLTGDDELGFSDIPGCNDGLSFTFHLL